VAGIVHASVGSSCRFQCPSADLLTVTEGTTTLSRTYDGRGRLKTFTTADGDLIQYLYDANNNLTRLTYPDGKQVNYTYNSRNLLATVTDWSSRVTSYSYDRLGRLTGTTRPNGTSNQIAHDAASQLSSIKESSGTKLISYLAFKYDAAGQIQSRFRAPLVNSGWQHPALTATYDDDNRLLTANGTNVTHDADGNMTRSVGILPTSPYTAVDLSYNSRNQLTYAAGVTYTYDAEGRRRTLTDATGTTRDAIDPSGKLLVRTHPNNTKTYYVYGLGLLYEASQAGTTKTYHFDQVGSTLARTDDSGKVIGQAEYSAYGLTIWKQGDMATPFLYNGQAGVQTDPNGLLNMRARYYSPYLMRFLNADPSGFSGGPNWFAYADGNPISKSDPFGLCATGGWGSADFSFGYDSWSQYGNDAADSLGGTAVGLLEGLTGGIIGIDNSTVLQMNEMQKTGYHIGLTTSLIGAFFAPRATSAPKAQVYSGVYIPEIDTIMMRPSTYIDPPPSGHVSASGGHAAVMAEMASSGLDVTNAQGFTAFSKGKSFDVEWKSIGVNGTNPNFQGSILPQELRPPVLNAIERTTGIPAVSTRKH
jgi:RHS repeat-associated protein